MSNLPDLYYKACVAMLKDATRLTSISIVAIATVAASPVDAQVIPDATLGAENSVVTGDLIRGGVSDRISGGARRDTNLFHSFSQFDVPALRGAYFENPAGVQNIFSRVTGSDRSEIFGRLGVIQSGSTDVLGTANLFFVNPNGILFGATGSLDVGGSFVATTANAIEFGDRGSFSASASPVSDVLVIDPSAFLFSQSVGEIQNRSTVPVGTSNAGAFPGQPPGSQLGLKVQDGRSLILLGGDVLISNSGLNAPGGRVEVGSVAGASNIGLTISGNTMQLSFPNQLKRGNITVTNGSAIDVIAGGGGDIRIYANNIEISRGSVISSGIGQGLGNFGQRSGDINLNATGTIVLSENSIIGNGVIAGIGSSGSIGISGQQIFVLNGSTIGSFSLGVGDAGSIALQADDTISLFGRGINQSVNFISTNVASLDLIGLPGFSGTGNGGNINLKARSVRLADESVVATNSLLSPGSSGSITVTAIDTLETKDGAYLSTSTGGQGNAGSIRINAGNRVSFTGVGTTGTRGGVSSTVLATANATTVRQGGEISIETGSLDITNGANVDSSTSGLGNAGKIGIRARDRVGLENGFIASNVNAGGIGSAGDITIIANSLALQNGGQIQSFLRQGIPSAGIAGANGEGGTITIQLSENFDAAGLSPAGDISGVFTAAEFGTIGDSGSIQISANAVSLSSDAIIITDTFSSGKGGNISITTNRLSAKDGGQISSGSGRQRVPGLFGRSGNIFIQANTIDIDAARREFRNNRSGIFAETSSRDRAGDITVITRDLNVLNGGAISSSAVGGGSLGGDGGSVQIEASGLVNLVGRESSGDQRPSFIGTEGQIDFATLRNLKLPVDPVNAGDVKITTGQLLVSDGALISSSNLSRGNAGNLSIQARDGIVLTNNGTIDSKINPGAEGSGGNIEITANTLSLSNRAGISAENQGTGNAGNVTIATDKTITLNNSQIRTTAQQEGGGNISITARNGNILLRQQSDIRTDLAGGQGSGGNIALTADAIIALENSDILAFAPEGKGGNITFNTRAFLSDPLYRPTPQTLDRDALTSLLTNGQVDVNASGAISGTVAGIPDITFLQNSLTQLSQNAIDPDTLIANSCIARTEQGGTFLITGAEGLRDRPGDPFTSSYPLGTVRPLPNSSNRVWKPGDPIVEPQGAYRLTNGRIVMSRECSN